MLGKIDKRVAADGSVTYSVRVELPRDARTGKRKRTRISAPTERELRRKVAEEMGRIAKGGFVEKDPRTVAEYMAEWMRVSVRPRTRITTADSYETMLRLHILPRIGRVRLQELHPRHLQGLYAELLASGRKRPKPGVDGGPPVTGLSPRTVRYCHTIIQEALEQAVDWGLLIRNVARSVDPPREVRHELTVLSPEEVARFLAAAQDHPLEPVWSLAVMTGMRRGEILGLRWSDIDFQRGEIRVRRARVVAPSSKEVIEAEPKTKAGRRVITLTEEEVSFLKRVRRQQAERRLAADEWPGGDLVCVSATGVPTHPRRIGQVIKELCRTAEIPAISFHALRHSHATYLLSRGVHPKVVQERLGHSTIAITMDTYSHLLPSIQRSALAGLSLFGDREGTTEGQKHG